MIIRKMKKSLLATFTRLFILLLQCLIAIHGNAIGWKDIFKNVLEPEGPPDCHSPLPVEEIYRQTFEESTNNIEQLFRNDFKILRSTREGFIEVNLRRVYLVTGLNTQGYSSRKHWVTNFQVYHSLDCERFTPITTTAGYLQNYTGNHDAHAVVTTLFHDVFLARCLRLRVLGYYNEPTMRLQPLGCDVDQCKSNTFNTRNKWRLRMSFTRNGLSWQVIKFPEERILTGVSLQGYGSSVLNSLIVQYSRTCMDYTPFGGKLEVEQIHKTHHRVIRLKTKDYNEVDDLGPKTSMHSDKQKTYRESEEGDLCNLTENIEFVDINAGIAGKCGLRKHGKYDRRPNNEISNTIHKRVVNGVPNVLGEWPWLVSLQDPDASFVEGKAKCGGSLIHPQWVLTAAHCFKFDFGGFFVNDSFEFSAGKYEIVVGEHNLKKKDGTEFVSRAEKVILHPEYRGYQAYNSRQQPSVVFESWNDIALIKLERPVALTDYVNTICLPDENEEFHSGEECVVAGWGMLNGTQNIYPILNHHVKARLMEPKACLTQYQSVSRFPVNRRNFGDSVVCTISPGKRQYTGDCYGDSGGPLVCKRNGRWYQVGVVSWGESCESPLYPSVFSRVQSYMEWINAEIEAN
ncbi:uncharacterized protein LOC141901270 [Tubulanus polymorphus]|uniref:uncharacterized protein LOC141901270 n=1 Tax=Tubulanus polymorphus TaxID=672921 RepID=UPI003DA5C4D0